MKHIVLSLVFMTIVGGSIFNNSCSEIKISSKKSQQSFACSQHGKKCNGNHGTKSKR